MEGGSRLYQGTILAYENHGQDSNWVPLTGTPFRTLEVLGWILGPETLKKILSFTFKWMTGDSLYKFPSSPFAVILPSYPL